VVAARLAAWVPVADERDVTLRTDGGSVHATATPGHVEQVLDNLIDNALEATAPSGTITVRVDAQGARLRFSRSPTTGPA
jgi:signal transduction histidine kinase